MGKSWPKSQPKGGPKTKSGERFQVRPSAGGGSSGGSEALGAELVTNGGFTTDTDWTKDTGWTIPTPVASAAATAAAAYLHQAVTMVVGINYKITYTITSFTSGNVAWSLSNGQTGAAQGGTGTFTEIFNLNSASAELRFGRVTADFTGSIDNVSLRQFG